MQLIDNGHGCIGSLEKILECGGNLNLANNFGHTPLHLAARRGDAVTASFLMFKGASVHAMDQVSLVLNVFTGAYSTLMLGRENTLTSSYSE
jgi:ankyrin repeat protein